MLAHQNNDAQMFKRNENVNNMQWMEKLYQLTKRKNYDYTVKCNKNEIEYGDGQH